MADLSGSRFKVELILEKLNSDYKMRAPGVTWRSSHFLTTYYLLNLHLVEIVLHSPALCSISYFLL